MSKSFRKNTPKCSFCQKTQSEVDKIIEGPKRVYICSDCVRLCLDIINENAQSSSMQWSGGTKTPPPVQINAFLDQYVIGQDAAKRKISVAVYNHYKRLDIFDGTAPETESDVEIQKSNLLLIGPTGTGKTLLAQTLARLLNVPFAIADATALTEAGYVGEDVENIVLKLHKAAQNNIDQTIRGIIYLDEIDKLAKRGSTASVSRDVSGEGVQQALLKIIEGTQATVQIKGKGRMPTQESVVIDTSNILFICGGSFEGLEKIIESRLGRRSVGFMADSVERVSDSKAYLKQATPEDLEKFGLIPEFIGRIPVIAVMNPLDVDSLVQILTEPKNSLVKQYQKLFRLEQVKLSFTPEALRAIAEKAVTRKAGARGLRTIIESIMLEIMYEMPSEPDLQEVIVTEATVLEGTEPELVYSADMGASS
ncbi:MAG: ATP-dependent Clp protease ATP-binding subunit ClpX [Myxococcota bacterium]